MNKRGQLGAAMIAIVTLITVVIGAEITQSVIDDAGLNGTAYTVISQQPVFIGLLGIMVVAAVILTLVRFR